VCCKALELLVLLLLLSLVSLVSLSTDDDGGVSERAPIHRNRSNIGRYNFSCAVGLLPFVPLLGGLLLLLTPLEEDGFVDDDEDEEESSRCLDLPRTWSFLFW